MLSFVIVENVWQISGTGVSNVTGLNRDSAISTYQDRCPLETKISFYNIHWKLMIKTIIKTATLESPNLATLQLWYFIIYYHTRKQKFDLRNVFGSTAWKVLKYGVISGPHFPVFGLNTEIYFGPETTPYLDNFHAV